MIAKVARNFTGRPLAARFTNLSFEIYEEMAPFDGNGSIYFGLVAGR
ncbi:MAG: hypothetical protein HY043_23815 [Verrucomicrobia bacterium]|nr:hypothetical protein [Verrucomicrobiota bacterium]